MKTILISLFALFTFGQISFAQQIETKQTFWGTKFFQNGEKITLSDVIEISSSNQKANELIVKAKKHGTLSTIFSVLSGASLGIGLGLEANDRNGTPYYIAAGALFVPAVVYSYSYINNLNNGIDLYNIDLAKSGEVGLYNPNLKFVFTGNGLGLTFNY